MSKKYNGWTNYATWRIHLEILGNIEFEKPVTIEQLKEIVENCVFYNFDACKIPTFIEDYARAFINEVNFYEIERNINDEFKLNE
tara:strand:+ start:254 stop:508 length:255 start_codon:yes stop_codon:yes gene_type:complete